MSALVTGFCAVSGGAIVGFLLGTVMSSGKLRDFELGYSRLSDATRLFLQAHLEGDSRLLPVVREDLLALRQGLQEADVLVGLCLRCEARYEGVRKSESRAT